MNDPSKDNTLAFVALGSFAAVAAVIAVVALATTPKRETPDELVDRLFNQTMRHNARAPW